MKIPICFLILGLFLGIPYAAFMGPWHVQDEEQHMYRTYLVSQGVCTGRAGVSGNADYFGGDFREEYRHFNFVQLPPETTARDLVGRVDGTHPALVVGQFTAVNLYNCLVYLPSGTAVAFGRAFTESPISLMYMGRLGNLIFYLLMIVAAMRILPEFQVPLAVLALMPMALHQGASLSADAVTMAVSFVLTAYILRLSVTDKPVQLQRSEYLLLALGVVVAGLCKASVGLAALVVLIPARQISQPPDSLANGCGLHSACLWHRGRVAVDQSSERNDLRRDAGSRGNAAG